ncbi:MAG: hypothetical protein ABI666_00960 [Ferruginibacter sp.]
MNIKTFLLFVLPFGFVSCNQADKKETKISTLSDNFIKPPVNGVDVPYEEYSVDAAKGDTLFYKTGSIILFPPNSFIDKNGNVIQGNVQVKYREFSNPIDFYLSGIPMDYDSVGKPYTFESSGMCEVLAYKDGVPVFVNPKSNPEINLASDNNSQNHNLYYLDTVQKKWVGQGTSIVTELNNSKNKNQATTTTELAEPLKPEKANTKSPVIRIVIDPASFQELSIYDNLQFQLDANEKNFSPKDAIDEWSNVELLKGKNKGLYTVKFSNAKRTVSYSARPVLEGKDYDKALTVFNKKRKEYESFKKVRITQEKGAKVQYIKDSLQNMAIDEQNKKTEKLNLLIEARNRVIEKQNAVVSEINKTSKVFRTFAIDRFGYWNCDVPVLQNLMQITGNFVDKKGNQLSLTHIAVFCKSFNSILRYRDNNIGIVKNLDNMILGVVNGEFAYISYEDYKRLGVTQNTKQQTFVMTVLSEKENNYENIKEISGL